MTERPKHDVFLSWSSGDGEIPPELGKRLKAIGLDVWEYSHDSQAGALVTQEILDEINDSRLALICFSDQTAHAQWIEREAAWCVQALRTGPVEHIVPVWIGAHPQNLQPSLLGEAGFKVTDLFAGGDVARQRLVDDITRRFGYEAPLVVPAAVFAMTDAECADLVTGNSIEKVADLCAILGMPPPPVLYATLRARYGDSAESLSPFEPNKPLVGIVETALTSANRRRLRELRRPLFLRWMQKELIAKDQEARDVWSSRQSLLVIDSISTFYPAVRDQIMDLPDFSRTSLLWVPPYTQHLATLEARLQQVTNRVGRIGDAFQHWRSPQPDLPRWLAFDTSSYSSVNAWLHQAFVAVADQDAPRANRLRDLQVLQRTPARRLSDLTDRRTP